LCRFPDISWRTPTDLSAFHGIVVDDHLRGLVNHDQIIFAGVGAVLVALGLPLAQRRVRPNFWYGLRIPATLADEHAWYEANAVTGRDTIVVGALLVLVVLALPHLLRLPPPVYALVYAAVLLVGTLVSMIRGGRLANRVRDERGGQGRP
jgi:uncharacterized membrane protein